MSSGIEDYLKAILILHQGSPSDGVRTSALSQYLDVSAAAVSDMVKKLYERGYVNYTPYKGVSLSKSGLSQAKTMLRRHRILEMYLNQHLGFLWSEVHDEAERLEHAVSDMLIDRMDRIMGFPKFDPHGDPIPDSSGEIPSMAHAIRLSDCNVTDCGFVCRVNDLGADFLTHMSTIGVHLNCPITIITHHAFDGSVTVEINGVNQLLSAFSARHIWLKDIHNRKE